MSKDPLLDHPLLTDGEIESLLTDVRAMQAGTITSIVNTDFWRRAMAELARRQIKVQIEIAKSLARATWALVVFTAVLAVVTAASVIFRLW